MRTSLTTEALAEYLTRQTEALFPDGRTAVRDLRRGLDLALERLEHCFSRIGLKYYQEGGEARYDHLHSDQHAALLYLLARALYAEVENVPLAAKVYGLNKALHAMDVFYEVELPAVFYFQHPVGTVLGRAGYGDYLAVYQGVTVGSDLEGNYPQLHEGVVLFGGARVIGRAHLGANTWVAPAAVVLDQSFPPDSVLFGMPPSTERRPSRRDVVRDFFRAPAARRPSPSAREGTV